MVAKMPSPPIQGLASVHNPSGLSKSKSLSRILTISYICMNILFPIYIYPSDIYPAIYIYIAYIYSCGTPRCL